MRQASRTIAILITCHNRKDTTLLCLDALFSSSSAPGVAFAVFLVDDGCDDGTAAAVRERHPTVRVLAGSGGLYWGGGMHLAFECALRSGFDAYVWLNDDTLLFPDALASMVGTWQGLLAQRGREVIVVGSTQDALTRALTYGGVRRVARWRPLRFALVAPAHRPVECETMWGNFVLIPDGVARAIGNLDTTFIHAFGDLDYGLRARRKGYEIWVMPEFAGTCAANRLTGTFEDTSLPMLERLRAMHHPKARPARAWKVLAKTHAGPFWVLYWAWPYVKIVLTSIARKLTDGVSRIRRQ